MVFNSGQFLVFLLVVLALDSVLQSRPQPRKWMLLLASYVFYGAWNWTYLALIMASTLIDFEIGKRMRISVSPRSLLLFSIVTNLGILAFFKYSNFLISAFNYGFASAHSAFQISSLDIILPVGISFFTFQALSYTIDVYRKEIAPRQSFWITRSLSHFSHNLLPGRLCVRLNFSKNWIHLSCQTRGKSILVLF